MNTKVYVSSIRYFMHAVAAYVELFVQVVKSKVKKV